MTWTLVRVSLRGLCLITLLVGGSCGLWLLVQESLTRLVRAWTRGGAAGVLDLPFPQVLTGLCACLVLLGSAWLSATTSLVVLLAIGQAVSRADTTQPRRARVVRFCPQLAQRLALAFCGLALSSLGSPGGLGGGPGTVLAGAPAMADARSDLSDLGGLDVPDRTFGGQGGAKTTRVVRGDSLWSICAGLLPTGAADAEITAAWHELYRTNLDVIGPNPDLILPGTTLQVPNLTEHKGKELS